MHTHPALYNVAQEPVSGHENVKVAENVKGPRLNPWFVIQSHVQMQLIAELRQAFTIFYTNFTFLGLIQRHHKIRRAIFFR